MSLKAAVRAGTDQAQHELRIDLAAAFRLAAEFNWHESVGNHFSVTVAPGSTTFLIKASDLLLLDGKGPDAMDGPDAPDPSAWAIHSRLHANLPQVRCLLHLHPPYATVLATLANPELKPIDQNTARFYERIAYDRAYAGIADEKAEGERLARVLGNRSIMIMGNHGVLVAGETVAQAFDDLYFLERACQTLVLAYSTGQDLNVMPHDLAARTANDWKDYSEMSFAHFRELKTLLDRRDPSYAS
jgi:ribulose-5-phosphate 4-epimerase/fuculose-1-phosphate aldolase